MKASVLSVSNLSVSLKVEKQFIPVVKNMNFTLEKGKVLGIIGESGSGKTITCLSLTGLLSSNKWAIEGVMHFHGRPVYLNDKKKIKNMRGKDIAMVMQNPTSSFNPLCTIESHFYETLKAHKKLSKVKWRHEVVETLKKVHIQDPEKVMKMYPFEMSGGMLQRIMIAMTIMLSPSVLIADEPTTALDVTVQKQILNELKTLKIQNDLSMILISHDLGVIAQMADQVMVMYAGEVVECASVMDLFHAPKHPYTRALMQSRPSFTKETLFTIEGVAPSIGETKQACAFYPRCKSRNESCLHYQREALNVNEDHWVCCNNFELESERPLNERFDCKRVV